LGEVSVDEIQDLKEIFLSRNDGETKIFINPRLFHGDRSFLLYYVSYMSQEVLVHIKYDGESLRLMVAFYHNSRKMWIAANLWIIRLAHIVVSSVIVIF